MDAEQRGADLENMAMRHLTVRGVKLDLAAMEDYLKTFGPEKGESEADRAELLRDLQEVKATSAYERKKWRVRCQSR